MTRPGAAEIRREHRQIGTYLGFAFLALYLAVPSAGLAHIPLQVLLKDRLGLGPEQISLFQLVVAIPTYVSFLFGFLRDRWSPGGRGDRGYFLVFGIVAVLGYGSLATGTVSPTRLLVGVLAATTAYRFLSASVQGLTAEVGQRRGMTGRLSALTNIVVQGLAALATFLGGWVTDHLRTEEIYGVLALLSLTFVALSFWRPRTIYAPGNARAGGAVGLRSLGRDVVRVLGHRPLWPAAAIWLLWNFTPGFGTAFFFYFTGTLKGTPTQLGTFGGILCLAFLPMFFLYGWLCRRVALGKLLLWGLVVAVPQMVPLLFLRSATQALWLAVPIGLMGGVATGALYDLILRASPKGFEGTGTMLADAGLFVAARFGDLLGAKIYTSGGYALTAWVTTGVYALMIPLLLLVPRDLLARRDATDAEEARAESGTALSDG